MVTMRRIALTFATTLALVTTASAFSVAPVPRSSTQWPALSSPLFQKKGHSTVRALESSVVVPTSFAADSPAPLGHVPSVLTKMGMLAFILGMCVALPVTLIPQQLLYKAKFMSKVQSERAALLTGEFCARWLLRIIPFCKIEIIPHHDDNPEPAIWVCNHQSMLDVFMLLASDFQLRGKQRRPIKIVYWKQLEDNPITKLLFQQCGFIPVQMADNGNGNDNEYDMSSFRTLLKETKQAFSDGFDIGILPEGQLNPHPEAGLLPIYSGAYTLARMSKRPIHMMAVHGIQNLWHPIHGMECTSRNIKVRAYPHGRKYSSNDDFTTTFTKVVGHFGQFGEDVKDLQKCLDGSEYKGRVPEGAV